MDIVETVLFTASQEKSIEECATRLRDLSDDRNPSPDTVLRRLGKLSKEQIFEMFDAFVAHNIAKAKRKGLLKRPVLVAIDRHDEPYYGKKLPPEVRMLYDYWLQVNIMAGWTPNPHYDYDILAREYRWWIECYTTLRHQMRR